MLDLIGLYTDLEPRRANKMHSFYYLDTVEVIGSIPVAPTLFLNQLHSSRFGQLLYFHTDFHTQLVSRPI